MGRRHRPRGRTILTDMRRGESHSWRTRKTYFRSVAVVWTSFLTLTPCKMMPFFLSTNLSFSSRGMALPAEHSLPLPLPKLNCMHRDIKHGSFCWASKLKNACPYYYSILFQVAPQARWHHTTGSAWQRLVIQPTLFSVSTLFVR